MEYTALTCGSDYIWFYKVKQNVEKVLKKCCSGIGIANRYR